MSPASRLFLGVGACLAGAGIAAGGCTGTAVGGSGATGAVPCDPLSGANIDVMYDATSDDGRRLVAFTTNVDYSDDKVRVFFGPPERLAQRTLLHVYYDSTVHLEIDLDGVDTTAQLNFCLGEMFGPTRLEQRDGLTTALTPVPRTPGDCSFEDAGPPAEAGAPDAGGAVAPAFVPPPRLDPATELAGLRFYCF